MWDQFQKEDLWLNSWKCMRMHASLFLGWLMFFSVALCVVYFEASMNATSLDPLLFGLLDILFVLYFGDARLEMKKKREHTGCAAKLAAAKTAGCGGGKTAEGRPRGGVVLPKTEGETAIADIFGAISKKPQKNSNRNRSNQNNTSGSIQHTAGGTPPKLCGDGLYRAPEKTLELSDTVFFDVASRRHGRDRNKSSDVVAVMGVGREGGELLRREGVSRIVTMEELRKITSSNPKAGTTPNCPFDCDCCF